MSPARGLVGDIGGTHARFALAEADGGRPVLQGEKTLVNAEHASAEAAIEAYLAGAGGPRPERVVLAVAGPVTDGAIHFTNSDWRLSEARLRTHGGFRAARLVNDFAAQALGAPHLAGDNELRRIGPAAAGAADAPIAVMGPGTGFGLGALVREGGAEAVVSTEGGHVSFAPGDELEVEIWRLFARRHGRVSIERLLSGPGLYEIYGAMAEIGGAKAALADEREVQGAAAGGDPLAAATVDRFCRILGGAAGDFALALGARGGVYISGGVAERLADPIASGGFRDRFEAKGRFLDYMRAIPTWLVRERYTALIGAARLLSRLEAP